MLITALFYKVIKKILWPLRERKEGCKKSFVKIKITLLIEDYVSFYIPLSFFAVIKELI